MSNNMFCFQCEQTAGCTGCTKSGVCGKTPEIANLQDKLTGALISLAMNKERNKENDADKISRLAQFDAKNQETLREIDYANKITKTIESYYVIRERQLIYKLEKEINKYLQQIYTGERKMKITPDYKFKLVFSICKFKILI